MYVLFALVSLKSHTNICNQKAINPLNEQDFLILHILKYALKKKKRKIIIASLLKKRFELTRAVLSESGKRLPFSPH